MQVVYKRPSVLQDAYFKYCGGCGHAIINKLIAEIIEEMDWLEETVMVCLLAVLCTQISTSKQTLSVRCMVERLLWRQVSNAQDLKIWLLYIRVIGDMVSEGMSEIIHAAIRGEKFSVIFVNNAIYGMTGGQMAPTTLEGQKTSTTPYGKSVEREGAPVNMAELISNIKGAFTVKELLLTLPQILLKQKEPSKKLWNCRKQAKA